MILKGHIRTIDSVTTLKSKWRLSKYRSAFKSSYGKKFNEKVPLKSKPILDKLLFDGSIDDFIFALSIVDRILKDKF